MDQGIEDADHLLDALVPALLAGLAQSIPADIVVVGLLPMHGMMRQFHMGREAAI